MKLKAILGAVTFTLQKYSPEILLGLGIAGKVVSTTVFFCATPQNLTTAKHWKNRTAVLFPSQRLASL